MSVLFLEYPPCSTCQKAKRWLEDNGVAYTARHIKTDNPTKEELTAWIARSGLPIKRFFNTRNQRIGNCCAKTRRKRRRIDVFSFLLRMMCNIDYRRLQPGKR